jgi:hypothetical protein
LADAYSKFLGKEGVFMDQPFESEVMEELAAETPLSSAEEFDEFENMEGEGLEEDLFGEMGEFEEYYAENGFEGDFEGSFEDSFEDGFEDGFAGDDGEAFEEVDALEVALADALDAEDADEFFGRLLSGISKVAGLVRRGAGAAGQVARTASRVARTVGRVAGRAQRIAGRAGRSRQPAATLLQQLLPLLRQYAAQGFDEVDALEDLTEQFAEEDMDEALPVLGALAARTLIKPWLARTAASLSRPVKQQLIRSATQAARTLMRRSPTALRTLPKIARTVGKTAARRRLALRNLPTALRSTAAKVASNPTLVRRLSVPVRRTLSRPSASASRTSYGREFPQRMVIRGPVEIRILSR